MQFFWNAEIFYVINAKAQRRKERLNAKPPRREDAKKDLTQRKNKIMVLVVGGFLCADYLSVLSPGLLPVDLKSYSISRIPVADLF
jgi:hypothetical protein